MAPAFAGMTSQTREGGHPDSTATSQSSRHTFQRAHAPTYPPARSRGYAASAFSMSAAIDSGLSVGA